MKKSKQIIKQQKAWLALNRELDRLWAVKFNAPWIELEKPIRRGWKKVFTLREDIQARKDADVFRQILRVINTPVYSRTKEFTRKDGKKIVPIQHSLKPIALERWEATGLPPHYRKYFTLGPVPRDKRGRLQYTFTKDWMFVSVIVPHFVTHVQTTYPEVESRIHYIYTKFQREKIWEKLGMAYKDRDWSYNRKKEPVPISEDDYET